MASLLSDCVSSPKRSSWAKFVRKGHQYERLASLSFSHGGNLDHIRQRMEVILDSLEYPLLRLLLAMGVISVSLASEHLLPPYGSPRLALLQVFSFCRLVNPLPVTAASSSRRSPLIKLSKHCPYISVTTYFRHTFSSPVHVLACHELESLLSVREDSRSESPRRRFGILA